MALPGLAAVGDLTYIDSDVGDPGMSNARGVAVSKDGQHVYVAGGSADAVALYKRAGNGTLTYGGCIKDLDAPVSCDQTAEGLNDVWYVAVSGDGKNVYASGGGDGAVVTLNRDSGSGALTDGGCWRDTSSSAVCGLNTAPALGGSEGIVVSKDGKNVYSVAQGDRAISTFNRDPSTGALQYASCISDVAGCPNVISAFMYPRAMTISADDTSVYAAVANTGVVGFRRDPGNGALTHANTPPGMAQLFVDVALSPDGKHLYAGSVNRSAIYVFSRDPATANLAFSGCIQDVDSGSGGCASTGEGLEATEGVVVSGDGASVYSTAYPSWASALATFLRSPSSGLLTATGCFRWSDRPPGGCGAQVPGIGSPRAVTMTRDAKFVYMTGQYSGGVVSFSREAVPGFDPDATTTPPPPEPTPPPPPPGPSPQPEPVPEACLNPSTLLVTCANPAGASGNCMPAQIALLPQCQRPYSLTTTCLTGHELACYPATAGTTACGSLGVTAPECSPPTRSVPGLCRPQGLGTIAAPTCGIEMAPVTVCPRPSGNVTPACSGPASVGTPGASASARTRKSSQRKVTVTVGCPKSLRAKGCRGHFVTAPLRDALRSTLTSQITTTGDVYHFYVPGASAYEGPFISAASKLVTAAFAAGKLPPAVNEATVLSKLGRSDALTQSFAGSLRRSVAEYRGLAGGKKPSKKATGAARRKTVKSKAFTIKKGARSRARLTVTLRRGAPVRVVAIFRTGGRPTARVVDLGLR